MSRDAIVRSFLMQNCRDLSYPGVVSPVPSLARAEPVWLDGLLKDFNDLEKEKEQVSLRCKFLIC